MLLNSKSKSIKDYECISLDKFITYFENKFSYNTLNENDLIHNLRGQVEQKYDQIVLEKYDFTFSEYLVNKFVHCLKPNSAPGGDGVLRFASDISFMLRVDYLQFVLHMEWFPQALPKAFLCQY